MKIYKCTNCNKMFLLEPKNRCICSHVITVQKKEKSKELIKLWLSQKLKMIKRFLRVK